MLEVPVFIGETELCKLEIGRLENLQSGKDRYKYRARFSAKEWRDGATVMTEPFYGYYSRGLLDLIQGAIIRLLREYPELRAGRFGTPRNRAKCRKCGDIIWSMHRHDFTRCRCGAVALDGGYDYFRVVAKDFKDVIRIPEPWQTPIPKKLVKKVVPLSERNPHEQCKHKKELIYCTICVPTVPSKWIGSERHEQVITKERRKHR
jgi:hypothetical protein